MSEIQEILTLLKTFKRDYKALTSKHKDFIETLNDSANEKHKDKIENEKGSNFSMEDYIKIDFSEVKFYVNRLIRTLEDFTDNDPDF